MKRRELLLGTAIALLILLVPLVHAEDISYNQPINDQAPFWHEWLSKIGLFSVTGYTGTPDDIYCKNTWNCVKTSDGKYRYDCYNSGLSPTSCLCSTTTDASKAGCSTSGISTTTATTTTTTNTATQSCLDSDGSNGQAMSSGTSDQSIYTYGKVTTTSNGYTNVFSDLCENSNTVSERSCMSGGSVGTWQFNCASGCSNGACVKTEATTGCKYNNPACSSGKICNDANTCVKTTCTSGGQEIAQGQEACNGNKVQLCEFGRPTTNSYLQSYWRDVQDCGSQTCTVQSGQGYCGPVPSTTTSGGTSPTKCSTNDDCKLDPGTTCVSGFCSGGDASSKKRSITDDEIKQINDQSVNVLTYTAKADILTATNCASQTDCQSNQCTAPTNIGLIVPTLFKPNLLIPIVGKPGFCYSGKVTFPEQTTNVNASKSLSLTLKEWQDTSRAQRLKTLCKLNDDCAPYDDLQDTGKEYSVACNSARTQGQLQEDVDEICESTGTDKYLAIGGGSLGFAKGCAIGAAAGAAAGGLGAVPGCVIGGVVGAVTIFTAVEGIHNTLQINCKEKTIPSDVGACIAKPKGLGSTFDSLTDEYNVFGVSLPLWAIILIGFIVFLGLLSALKK